MQIIEKTTEFYIPEKTAIAIGKFDGIHRGHRALLENLEIAKKRGLKAAVFTFFPSPAAFFSGQEIKELTTKEEKRLLFGQMGIDYLVEYPLCPETASIAPDVYVKEFLLGKMNGALIAAGEDVSFGKGGKGNRELLEKMSVQCGFELKLIQKLKVGEREISSTYVREEILAGRMEKAAELMGEPYFVSGRVENGKKLGRRLGMPTANLYPAEDKLLPPNGVYFSRVSMDKKTYQAVTNIGKRPTIKDGEQISAETYLLDFAGDIYGKFMKVELLHFKRGEKKFRNEEQLRQAVGGDILEAGKYFGINTKK